MTNILDHIGTILNVISILILAFGLVFFYNKNRKTWVYLYITCLLLFETSAILKTVIINNNILLILSFIVHFLFLTHFYFTKMYSDNREIKITVYIVGLLLVVSHLCTKDGFFRDYARFILSLTITIYSLLYLYYVVGGRLNNQIASNILNYTVLFFFCIDAFLAIATDYLVSNHLSLVSWFWFFRALLLQTFYIGLIYYALKSHTVQTR